MPNENVALKLVRLMLSGNNQYHKLEKRAITLILGQEVISGRIHRVEWVGGSYERQLVIEITDDDITHHRPFTIPKLIMATSIHINLDDVPDPVNPEALTKPERPDIRFGPYPPVQF